MLTITPRVVAVDLCNLVLFLMVEVLILSVFRSFCLLSSFLFSFVSFRGLESLGSVLGWLSCDRLVGLVVRRPPQERKIPGSNPACVGIFLGSSHTSDSKTGAPVATLPGA